MPLTISDVKHQTATLQTHERIQHLVDLFNTPQSLTREGLAFVKGEMEREIEDLLHVRFYRDAAYLYGRVGWHAKGAEQLMRLQRYKLSAQLFHDGKLHRQGAERLLSVKKYALAAELFKKGELYEEGAERLLTAGKFKLAAGLFHKGKLHEQGVHALLRTKSAIGFAVNLFRQGKLSKLREDKSYRLRPLRYVELYGRLGMHGEAARAALYDWKYDLAAKHFEKGNLHAEGASKLLDLRQYELAARLYEKGKLYEQGATAFIEEGRAPVYAANLYRAAGLHERGGDVFSKLGNELLAAQLYTEAGLHEKAGVQYLGAVWLDKAVDSFHKAGAHLQGCRAILNRFPVSEYGGHVVHLIKLGGVHERGGDLLMGYGTEAELLAARLFEEAAEANYSERLYRKAARVYDKAGKPVSAQYCLQQILGHLYREKKNAERLRSRVPAIQVASARRRYDAVLREFNAKWWEMDRRKKLVQRGKK